MQLSRLHDDIIKKFAYVRIEVPQDLKNVLSKWSIDNISDKSLAYAARDNPRVTEFHITVKYGIYTNNPNDIYPIISNTSPFSVKLGDISTFDYDDYQILKVDIRGSRLHVLHSQLMKRIKNEETHVKYQPHITLAYMKYGEANKFISNDIFYNYSFMINKATFVDSEKNKTPLSFRE
jgi:2'-5' RNA ligase